MGAVRKRLKSQKREEGNISILSDDVVLSEVTEWVPTLLPGLDHSFGGGWPVKRASEVFGPEGCGKSALSHLAILGCQSIGGTAILLDFETALDPDKMDQLGIDEDRLIYATPEDIEEAWDIVWSAMDYIESHAPKAPTLLVWDSVAASVPRAELEEKDSSKAHVAQIARSMSKGCRKMYRRIAKVNAHMMWINQERANIGGGPFSEKNTVGGSAVKYAASLRVRLSKRMTIKAGDVATGILVQAYTKKNRMAPPYQKAKWVLDFEYGPSPDMTMFQILLDEKVIKSSGGGYYVGSWAKDQKFKKRGPGGWREVLENDNFRAEAEEKYKSVVTQVSNVEESESEDEE